MADRPLPQLPPLPDEETRTLEQAAAPPDPPPEPPPRRRARPEGDDGPPRKLASAGHALVVCVLALALMVTSVLGPEGVAPFIYFQF